MFQLYGEWLNFCLSDMGYWKFQEIWNKWSADSTVLFVLCVYNQ